MILVDTSVWIDFFRPRPGAAGQELRRVIERSEPFGLTGLIVTEILQGLTRDVDRINSFLSRCPVFEANGISTYREAAAVFRLARSKGVAVATVDAVIAVIAIEQNASVFTVDRDFSRIARLTNLSLYAPRP